MKRLLQIIFFALIIRPLVLIVIGLHVRHRERLPKSGPAILVANHNSHLDTAVLMSLFSLRFLKNLRPVAAADYFLKNRIMAWVSTHIMGIIPIARKRNSSEADPLFPIGEALARGEVIIFYPEGTRGEAERMMGFRSGIAKLAERHPSVPIYPIFLNGLGKSLPKGEGILVPFFCDVVIGEPLRGAEFSQNFLEELESRVKTLALEIPQTQWE